MVMQSLIFVSFLSMGKAKDILIKPINASISNAFCKKHHYSGKVVQNSKLHFGVFYKNNLEGVLQFGSPMHKRKVLPLVKNTLWNEMLELNRMAFSDILPRNSESRSISITSKIIKKNYPHIKWILSYSDATQCGDGTIYRASGFLLTGIKKNKAILLLPDGRKVADQTLGHNCVKNASWWKKNGAVPLEGFQLRYILFLNDQEIQNLTADIIPFSKIKELGAGMYKGKKRV